MGRRYSLFLCESIGGCHSAPGTQSEPLGSTDVLDNKKGVFANQMKTVFSKVIQDVITTESGVVVDAVFGGKSINARIVNNPVDIGTTNTLLEVIGRKAFEIYKGT